MEYAYYIHSYNGLKTLYRINKVGKIYSNVETLEAYQSGKWLKDTKAIKSFMNHYVTGWINEDDTLDYETAIKILNNE